MKSTTTAAAHHRAVGKQPHPQHTAPCSGTEYPQDDLLIMPINLVVVSPAACILTRIALLSLTPQESLHQAVPHMSHTQDGLYPVRLPATRALAWQASSLWRHNQEAKQPQQEVTMVRGYIMLSNACLLLCRLGSPQAAWHVVVSKVMVLMALTCASD